MRTSTIGRSPEIPLAHSFAGAPSLRLSTSDDGRRRRIGIEHPVCQALEQVRFVVADAEVMELDLRLGPRKGHRALEGIGVVMLVREIDCLGAGRRDHASKTRRARWLPAVCARGGAD